VSPLLDIVIVNWNSGRRLRACLESIIGAGSDGFKLSRVVVVDNSSSDESAVAPAPPGLPLILIRNPENAGFGAACNQGAKGSKADYMLFLNPDTLLSKFSLPKLLAFMQRPNSLDIGIAGVQLLNDRGEIGRTCARFPAPGMFISKLFGLDLFFPDFFSSHFLAEWDHRESREVDQVMGAFFLVRRPLFEALNGFDERFFLYFEEVDFSLRARRAGWRSFYLSEAQAYHEGGGSSEQVKAKRLFYSLRSRILYGYKHFGFMAATGLALATLFLEPWTRLALAIARGSGRQMIETLGAYARLWKNIVPVLRRARS